MAAFRKINSRSSLLLEGLGPEVGLAVDEVAALNHFRSGPVSD